MGSASCKKRKQSLDRRRGKTRIYVGNHIDRWLTLKEKLDFRNDAEVAGFLLDLIVTVKEEREMPPHCSSVETDNTLVIPRGSFCMFYI
uniref:Zinc finger protein 692 n=1 Tax=Meleagris gallopavo TaxID=9103 RepID=A0A803YBN0_MELGA